MSSIIILSTVGESVRLGQGPLRRVGYARLTHRATGEHLDLSLTPEQLAQVLEFAMVTSSGPAPADPIPDPELRSPVRAPVGDAPPRNAATVEQDLESLNLGDDDDDEDERPLVLVGPDQ